MYARRASQRLSSATPFQYTSLSHRPQRHPQLVRWFSADSKPYDVIVIGGGPGGYVAAIKAAQMGLRTGCIEARSTLGGTCLNIGCIPSKALLNASHMYHDAHKNFSKYGIDIPGDQIQLNLKQMMAYKGKSVNGLTKGIEYLFKKNKVDFIKGFGKIESAGKIHVAKTGGGEQTIEAKNIIIATGSVPASLPGIEVDEDQIMTSTGALDMKEVPKHMVVIGAGVIGLEMGSVWSRLGAKLTVIEFGDRITPGIDTEVATSFKKLLEKQGFSFKLGMKVTNIKKQEGSRTMNITLESAKGGKTEEIEADAVLLSTGRRPYTKGLGIEELGLKMEGPGNSQIWVDDHFRTSVKGIYAIGDCIRGPMLAHKAEEEGIAAAEIIAGKPGHVNYNAIPGVIYTHPEVATVGASEDELKKQNIGYKVQKFPMVGNSRAKTNDDADGFVKVLVDKETDRILGAHLVATNAGELIQELVLGIEYGASAEDIARTCHAHPTLMEAVKEACMVQPIHM